MSERSGASASGDRYLDGPYPTREIAWQAAEAYAFHLRTRSLTSRFGVRVRLVPGQSAYALYLSEHDDQE